MNRQYFKLIFRDLFKRKSFTLINISGLALGFAVCLLTVLYVYTEFSFDRHIPSVANKYRIIWGPSDDINAILPYAFREKLDPQLPEGTQTCLVSSPGSQNLTYNHNDYKSEHTLFSDSRFLSMFGSTLLQGDTTKLLDAPLQVILSEHVARQIFGNQNPVNQTVRLWLKDFTVTGVFRDLPETSHQRADVVVSALSWKNFSPSNLTSWGNKSCDYYLSFPPNVNITQLQEKIKTIYLDSDPGFKNASAANKSAIRFELEPITDIHLKSGHVLWDDDKNKGTLGMVVAFIVIGLLILLMAAFNYINLSTAYFQTKNTFSGIQKVLGANSGHLVQYIFMQTSVMVVGGFTLSLILVKLFLPYFNLIIARKISFLLLLTPKIIGFVFLIVLVMVLLSGLYPAIHFSRENPVLALKRKARNTNFSFRKVLVIAQFVISMALVSGVLIMGRQIRMMSVQKLGFNAEQLMEMNFDIDKTKFELFKNQLKNLPGVVAVSAASNTPAEYINNENPFRLSSETDEKNREGASVVGVTPNYFDVLQIRMLEGVPFTEAMEKQNMAILSKTASDMLGLSNPLGERVHLSMNGKDYTIAGIVDDVQYRSLRETPKPVVYLPDFDTYNKAVVRLGKGNHVETLAAVKTAWHSISPDVPFEFRFFGSKLQQNYEYEISTVHLLNVLVIISILISSLGIFGLIMEITVQRTKEIGVRKVNGAKISEVMVLLNRDFVKWVAIAFTIATPIAYFAMNKWLENFAYKTTLSWWIFALVGLLALGIALLTVSWQSWQAATRNPVEALRYE
jgi:putative ABC transport system permease protein